MPLIAPSKESAIAATIAQAAVELQPDVEHIFWNVGQDWSGDLGLFLRVVLSDAAARRRQVFRLTEKLREDLLTRLQPDELGLIPYFSFRSSSEQAELREKAWT